eukprot:1073791-Prymnesium_polylepis.1
MAGALQAPEAGRALEHRARVHAREAGGGATRLQGGTEGRHHVHPDQRHRAGACCHTKGGVGECMP